MAEQTIVPPDLDDVLAESREAVLSGLNCVQVGKIARLNLDQTCEIQIQFLRRKVDGTTATYPLLVDCPYFVLQGGGAYIDFPIQIGDDCLVLFNDRNIDAWWDTGAVTVPSDTRKHSISDGFALIGINKRISALPRDGVNVRILGRAGAGNEQFAARVNDPVISTGTESPAFWQWVTTITNVVNSLSSNGVGPAPTSQLSKIQTGSTGVKIG